jgi:hypothetical protein
MLKCCQKDEELFEKDAELFEKTPVFLPDFC